MPVDWDKLRIFHAVASAGSFTRAADAVMLSQSAVSRQIKTLEDELGTQLFRRHARGLELTEQGDLLHRTVADIYSRVSVTEAMLREGRDEPRGKLRVAATVAFGSTWLTPRMRKFVERYPDIEVTLILDDQELDLPLHQADMGVRMRPPTEEGLVRLKLTGVMYGLFAARDYAAKAGLPRRPEDLDGHPFIAFGDDSPAPIPDINWPLSVGRPPGAAPRRTILRVNNLYGVMLAIESGLGVGGLPDYLGLGNPKLVPVLPDLDGPRFDIHLVYPEELRGFGRIQAFRDFLVEELTADSDR